MILLCIITLSDYSLLNAETTKFNATRDVWISAYPGEETRNMGATDKLKLKGIQEMAILDFDLSSLKGKKIESARLYICDAVKDNKLRKIGMSTVASQWVEGKSSGYLVDLIGRGASFRYASYKRQNWAGEGSDLTDVIMGRGSTWQHHTELKREDGMWWSVDVASELIYALINDHSYGLLLMDESGQTFANNYVYSRESGFSPYLIIDFSNTDNNKPLKPDVELVTSPENAHMEYGAVVLKISLKEDLFAFDMFVNNEKVPLWRIPRPEPPNTTQEIVVDWLPPGQDVDIKISAVDKFGQSSEPAIIKGHASVSLPRIAFPEYSPPFGVKEKRRLTEEGERFVSVWAVPDVAKVDPVSGRIIEEADIEGFDRINPIWSSDEKQIMLAGIKGEIIGFQICIATDGKDIEGLDFKVSSLINNEQGEISADRFNFYQEHYLKVKGKWYPELAIPMKDGKINVNFFQNNIAGRKNQLIYIDLSIPDNIQAGIYTGTLSISGKEQLNGSLGITLDVKNIAMPKKLVFVPELNMYKGPGKTGSERFYSAHRIAHDHRSVINRVPYSQDGRVHADMIPEISYMKDGRIKIDWMDYDRRLGPLFDGAAFKEGMRKGVPVEKFYLPFFENWPSDLASHYKYHPETKKTSEIITKHALESPTLNDALTGDYKKRFIDTIKEFVQHFKDRGWNQTEFQFYLNNKWNWDGASSWWDLDEPVFYDDFMALRSYGSLFHQATGTRPGHFIFRADISRLRWQHDWLNGILDRMYVQSDNFFKYPERARHLREEGLIKFSVYGSLNDIDSSNQQSVMWCMKAFVEGADGVLPWQSLAGTKAFTIPNRNALIVDAREKLDIDWVVSLRVKALRRGQQNAELLALLEEENGYQREQIRDFVHRYFNFDQRPHDNDHMNTTVKTVRMESFRKTLIEMLAHERIR